MASYKEIKKYVDTLAGVTEDMDFREKFFKRGDKIRELHNTLGYDKENLELRTDLYFLYAQEVHKFRSLNGMNPNPNFIYRKPEKPKAKKPKPKAPEKPKGPKSYTANPTPAPKVSKGPEIVYKKPSRQPFRDDSYYQQQYAKRFSH